MAVEKIKILGAVFSFYVKSIATYAPAFLVYNNSVLARVYYLCTELILDFFLYFFECFCTSNPRGSNPLSERLRPIDNVNIALSLYFKPKK